MYAARDPLRTDSLPTHPRAPAEHLRASRRGWLFRLSPLQHTSSAIYTMQTFHHRLSSCIRALQTSSSSSSLAAPASTVTQRGYASAVASTSTSNPTPAPEPDSQPAPEASTSAAWTPAAQRTGVLAKKLGMTAIYDSVGVRTPVTVLQVGRRSWHLKTAGKAAQASLTHTVHRHGVHLHTDGRRDSYCGPDSALQRCPGRNPEQAGQVDTQCFARPVPKEQRGRSKAKAGRVQSIRRCYTCAWWVLHPKDGKARTYS